MPGGLEFNDFSSDYLNNNKSTFRKAGDAFTVGSGNTINNSSTGGSSNTGGSAYNTWMAFMGSQSANNNSYSSQSNNQNAQTSASGTVQQPAVTEQAKSVKDPSTSEPAPSIQANNSPTMKPPKSGKYYADYDEVKAAWGATYDEDKYKYYVGNGSGTGADAYHTDMAKYQAQMLTMGDNPHLGLVNSMMHPDWQDHNYNGTYGKVNQNADWSSPNNAKWQRYEQQQKKMASMKGGL